MGDLDNVIASIVNEYHWPPNIIDNMYCDNCDHHGLIFWYEKLQELHKRLKEKTKQK